MLVDECPDCGDDLHLGDSHDCPISGNVVEVYEDTGQRRRCERCEGDGLITAGHVTCPRCNGSGKEPR